MRDGTRSHSHGSSSGRAASNGGASDTRQVILVDDHPVVRQGLMRLVNLETDLAVTGEASSAEEALALLEAQTFDLAVVDITLEGVSGLELVRQIRAQHEGVRVLVLSMHHERFYAERALRAGAQGYVMKQRAPDKIIEAIRRVLEGDLYLSEELSDDLLRRAVEGRTEASTNPAEVLSDRELEVLQLIGQGVRTRDIAEQLTLSIKTIESYRANIKRKLDLQNATELAHYAFAWYQATSDPNNANVPPPPSERAGE
ncbi:MAG: response regulator transcription factor [Bacteroidota bacterium]